MKNGFRVSGVRVAARCCYAPKIGLTEASTKSPG